jgi:hypothetical protein
MSFQAYLDAVKKKTGKSPADFRALAQDQGLLHPGVKAGPVLAWLTSEFGLGRGHAMAIYATLKSVVEPKRSDNDRIEEQFSGDRAVWRKSYTQLLSRLKKFGAGVSVDPTDSYISILRDGRKFAILQITAKRVYVGIKRKGVAPTKRFTPAGTWNAMVTHRASVESPKQFDAELFDWMRSAFDEVKSAGRKR